MQNKTVLITGATSGIGNWSDYETMMQEKLGRR